MSTSAVPGVSVVIVNFRGADDTLEAVARLREVDWPATKLDIVVVENASGDGSEAKLRGALSTIPNARMIVAKANLGFTGGSNLGAEHATGEYVAFLNNDAKPDRAWIREAIAEFTASPRVAAVASKVLDWEGKRVDFVGGSLTWFGMGYKDRVGEKDSAEFDVPRDILFGTGSALFVKRDVFRDVGGFDEDLFMFYDDVDLGWRLNLFGYRVRFAPGSIVFHKHHGSMASFGHHREMYLLERNALFLLYKNLSGENLGKLLPAALALVARRSTAKSGIDSTSFDIRQFTGEASEHEPTTEFAKESIAGLFALDQFVEQLPQLEASRAAIQARRVRSDGEVFQLFGDTSKPLFDAPHFLQGLRNITDAFGIGDLSVRRNVLVITGDALGAKMAGPGMRAWKISEALAERSNVRLVTWNVASRSSPSFAVERVPLEGEREMRQHEEWADVIVFQGYALHHFKALQNSKKIMVVDLYDPMHLEQLEQGREWGAARWKHQVASATEVLNAQLVRGDFFLCASERQRNFWLGQLAAVGRINPENYAADENLNSLLAIAPFGMDSTPPRHVRKAIRGVMPGIGEDDKVVIWGGGIYNWFDTLTLVRAIAQLAERRPNVRLFFLGVTHPNPDVPEMAIVSRTRELADQLGVAGKNVFFNQQWVALDDRANYLLEADAGVSTHYDHVETTFSFRTRILDYMWAGLPIVSTRGDSFADLIARDGLGEVVPERDVDALANALEKVLYDDEFSSAAKAQVERVRAEFTWEKALAPLVEFCSNPHPAADRPLGGRVRSFASSSAASTEKKSEEQKFHEIANRRPGVTRDAALAGHYLRYGGIKMLRAKVEDRRAVTKSRRSEE